MQYDKNNRFFIVFQQNNAINIVKTTKNPAIFQAGFPYYSLTKNNPMALGPLLQAIEAHAFVTVTVSRLKYLEVSFLAISISLTVQAA